jgi:hypothetical protein
MPITISALAYYSNTISDFSKEKPITIYLRPKVFELNEVVINSRVLSNERKAKLLIFKSEFLGTTVNGRNCEILNENDIVFNSDNESDTLKAFASKPILIRNNQLGFKITYYLDNFEYYKKSKSFFYKGSIIFNKDFADSAGEKQFYSKRRKDAYLGSRMQFFKALWMNNLKSAGFAVTTESYEKLNYNSFVVQGDSLRKFLTYPEKLGICYYGRYPSTYIIFIKEKIAFDKNGYFDPLAIAWDGQMAKQRVGDLLPYEFNNK